MTWTCSARLAAAVLSFATAGLLAAPAAQDVDRSQSVMRPVIERYVADRDLIDRYWDDVSGTGRFGGSGRRGGAEPFLPAHLARLRQLDSDWTNTLSGLDFDRFAQDAKIDYILMRSRLDHELAQLERLERVRRSFQPLVAFDTIILSFDQARRRGASVDAEAAARTLDGLAADLARLRRSPAGSGAQPASLDRASAAAAVAYVGHLRDALRTWSNFYNGYDPKFTWWIGRTYKDADQALEQYAKHLLERFGGSGAKALGIDVVDPIGPDALRAELAREFIPYAPEQLVAMANQELAWCEREMLEASRALGFGDDWRQALEHVKGQHVDPGEQPAMVRGLVEEGIAYVEAHDLVTVPALAKEAWRMAMMSAERQLVSPFFLGGEAILISYPTDSMSYEQKMMSMRGNNRAFSRAVAFHEMIPGHELQAFMSARYRTYRAPFGTPFWTEGNALWWEMLFYDMGFPRTPEERIGMLFWRMHRCARIIFSLGYHLGTMTPEQAVDFLVDRVGHERANAEGEVRRSFNGSYPPLYQCAYMLGALQFRALYRELVVPKKMTARAFHDAILQENRIPVELIRADLEQRPLTRDFQASWRFYDTVTPE